jgi:DNA mismatch endonuclease, patch repair protein
MPHSTDKAPRFDGCRPASRAASRAKSRNVPSGTRAECLLRKELWRRGYRYRKNVPHLAGKPDIVFSGSRVAIFVDGDFWHGRNWEERRERLASGANAEYWIRKISYNIERDERITAQLEHEGWTVVRVWETDVLRSVDSCCQHIILLLRSDSAP